MATKEQVQAQLDSRITDLGVLDRANIIAHTALRLGNALGVGRTVPIDNDVIDNFETLRDRLTVGGARNDLTQRRNNLHAQLVNLRGLAGGTGSIADQNLTREIADIDSLVALTARGTRLTEYNEIHTAATNLENTPVAPPPVNTGIIDNAGNMGPLNLATNFVGGGPGIRSYDLVMRDGTTVLRPDGIGRYTYVHNGTPHTLTGIIFNRDTGALSTAGFTITPPDLDFTTLDLAVRATTQIHGLNLFKDKNITINLPGAAPLTVNQRRQAVEDYNNMGGGVLHHEIQHQWNNDHENIERGMVMEALQRLNATKAALLDTPEKRQACFDYLRAGYTGQPGWNNFDRENNFVDFNGFANWFSTDARRDEILRTNPRANRSVADFTAAIHSIHREEIGQRMRSRYTAVIDDQNNNYHNRRWLMARFDTFLDLMNRSSVDDFGAAGRSNQHLQNHGIAMESQRRFRIGPGRGWIRFGANDYNYLSFFSKESAEIPNQELTLRGENEEPHSITYSMKLNVVSAKKMTVELRGSNLQGYSQEHPLKIPAANPMDLMSAILQNPQIPYDKEKQHMAYNVVRSMIQLAREKNIPLSYQDHHSPDITHTLQLADNGNVTLATNELEIDLGTGARRQHIETIFDYNQHFAPTNNRNINGYSLENNLTDMINHFTQAMNQKYQGYRRVMSNRWFNSNKFKANLQINRWSDPAKFLANLGTTRKFDWGPVSVNRANERSTGATVAFAKNKFTVTYEGETYGPSSLQAILNKRKRRKGKIFDGINLDIVATVSEQMLTGISQNNKIADENSLLSASDWQTGRLYFFDGATQEFSYVEAHDRALYDRELRRVRTGEQIAQGVGAAGLGIGAGVGVAGALPRSLAWGKAVSVAGAAIATPLAVNQGRKTIGRNRRRSRQGNGDYQQKGGVIMNKANINDTHRVIITDPRERRALLQNETVMNQLLRSANKRMGSFESMRALLTNNFGLAA